MSILSGPITFGTTGTVNVGIGFTPSGVMFSTGGKYSVNETTNSRHGAGFATPDYQWATAELTNTSGYFTRNYLNTACFAVLDGSSGNPVVKGSITAWGSTITFNITDASSNFPVFMTVFP